MKGLFADDVTLDEAEYFEVAVAIREHLTLDAVDVRLQVVETERAGVEQPMDDHGVPLLPDERGRRRDRPPVVARTPHGQPIGILGHVR